MKRFFCILFPAMFMLASLQPGAQVIDDMLYILGSNRLDAIYPGDLTTPPYLTNPLKHGYYNDMELLGPPYDMLVFGSDSLFLMSVIVPGMLVDTVPGAFAFHICTSDSLVVTSATAPPYFRVYNVGGWTLDPLFSLDTTKVPYTPQHIACHDNMAYLALTDRILVVDLGLQDTVASVTVPGSYPPLNFIAWLTPMDEHLYIDMEYATALVRFSFLRLDYSDNSIDSLFHKEGLGNFAAPVPHPDQQRIFMLSYPSYYSIPDDSLYLTSLNPFPTEIPLLIDDSLPWVHYAINHLSYTLFRYEYGVLTDSLLIGVPAWNAEIFHSPVPSVVEGKQQQIEVTVWPNPAAGMITVSSAGEIEGIRITGIRGESIVLPTHQLSGGRWQVDVSILPAGTYLIECRLHEGISSAVFVKE